MSSINKCWFDDQRIPNQGYQLNLGSVFAYVRSKAKKRKKKQTTKKAEQITCTSDMLLKMQNKHKLLWHEQRKDEQMWPNMRVISRCLFVVIHQ